MRGDDADWLHGLGPHQLEPREGLVHFGERRANAALERRDFLAFLLRGRRLAKCADWDYANGIGEMHWIGPIGRWEYNTFRYDYVNTKRY